MVRGEIVGMLGGRRRNVIRVIEPQITQISRIFFDGGAESSLRSCWWAR